MEIVTQPSPNSQPQLGSASDPEEQHLRARPLSPHSRRGKSGLLGSPAHTRDVSPHAHVEKRRPLLPAGSADAASCTGPAPSPALCRRSCPPRLEDVTLPRTASTRTPRRAARQHLAHPRPRQARRRLCPSAPCSAAWPRRLGQGRRRAPLPGLESQDTTRQGGGNHRDCLDERLAKHSATALLLRFTDES